MDSDASLVARYRQGDPEAFAAILARYRGPVFGYILGRVADRHQAEDLAQETFVRCLSRIDRLRNPAALSGWLFRIAGNLVKDSYRSRSDEVGLMPTLSPVQDTPGSRSASDAFAAQEQSMLVARKIAMLPEKQRIVVLLRHQVGLSCREIATVLGTPLGSVTKWLSRAYESIKEMVGARA